MIKNFLPLLLLLLSTAVVAQKNKTEKLMQKADEAFTQADYQGAEEQYEAVVQRDSTYSDAWYNLAVTRVYQENLEGACRAFYKAYALGAYDAFPHIQKYCGTVLTGEIMFADQVDEMPQFRYFWKYEPLIVENGDGKTINPHFKELLLVELKREFRGFHGAARLRFSVDKHGNLIADVLMGDEGIAREFEKLVQELTTYKPATYKGQPVSLWTFYNLPINISIEEDKRWKELSPSSLWQHYDP